MDLAVTDRDSAIKPERADIDQSTDVDDRSTESSAVAESANASVKSPPPRHISVSLRGLVTGSAIGVLIIVVSVMTWLYIGLRTQLGDRDRQAADDVHAEQVALDYAVNAAVMDYRDLGPWKQNLVKGTTPELGDKLTKAGTAMEQIVLPLQWTSTAKPIAAKVRSHENGVYTVDAFVSVMTKTVQAAEGLQSTATYSITIDSNNAWHISDVGGIAAVVGDK